MEKETVLRGIVIQSASTYIEDGGVVLQGNEIIDVDTWKEISEKYSSDEYLGSSEHIILPGFVNTHTHAVQTLFRGAADDLELLPWLENVILPGEATLTEDELEASCRIGYAEMLLSGITTCNDMLTANHASRGMQAAVDSGIRGRVGKMLMDRNVPEGMNGDTTKVLTEAKELADQYPSGGRIQYSFTPRFIPTCTDKLMREASRLAQELDLMFHTHASENQGECALVEEMTGQSYIQKMKDLDALGPHVILAHAVWTSQEERELLQETSTNISHNPSSNAKLASGVAPVPEYTDLDLDVGLASDGSPATGGHDFFLEMRLASFLQKATRLDPQTMPARKIFYLATEGGAHALNYDDIGKIEKTYKADIVMLNPKQPSAHPIYDPYSFVAYTAQTRDIEHVFVDGRIMVRSGDLIQDLSEYYQIAKRYAKERPFETRDPKISR